jgi:hypothetical protein
MPKNHLSGSFLLGSSKLDALNSQVAGQHAVLLVSRMEYFQ